MQSAAEHHKLVPKGRLENLAYRLWLLGQSRDTNIRKAVLAMCRDDFVFWVNSFVIQYNPLKPGAEVGPFVTWDFQDEVALKLLWCIRNKKSAVIEKSREMGGTYLCLLVFVWACLFHHHKKFIVISRSAEAVDKAGESDCVFWKIDQVLDHLPDWMKGGVKRRKMTFNFDRTNSRITGYASTGVAGVGGRATAILCDEFSLVAEDKMVRQKTASTTDCRIFNGTHQGPNTEFFNLCQQPEMVKVQIHWSQHPDKRQGLYLSGHGNLGFEVIDRQYPFPPDYQFVTDGRPAGGPFPGLRSPWYDQKCRDIGDERGVAMELDMDAKGSQAQIVDPLLIRELIATYSRDPIWQGDITYDRDTGEPRGLVPNLNGLVKLWCQLTGDGKLPPGRYFFGADISAGRGVTNSCLSAIDQRGKKVLEVATPYMEEVAFAVLAVALCRFCADEKGEGALLCWERQGPGDTFGKRVLEVGYRRVYYKTDDFKLNRVEADVPGWLPTNSNKRELIKDYFTALKLRHFLNHSQMALEECLDWKYSSQGVVEHGGQVACRDPSGAGENHGDRTIADAIAWMLCKPLYFAAQKPENQEVRPNTLAFRMRLHQNAQREKELWG